MLVITNIIVEKFMQLNGSNPIIVENSTKICDKKNPPAKLTKDTEGLNSSSNTRTVANICIFLQIKLMTIYVFYSFFLT